MRLGDVLVARGLCTIDDIERATTRQKTAGGRLGENLVALGVCTVEQINEVMVETPQAPKTVADTDVSGSTLLALLLKFMHLRGCESALDLSEAMKLPPSVCLKLILEDAGSKKLVQSVGSSGVGLSIQARYQLTEAGRKQANEAIAMNLYLGPAPVSLNAFVDRIQRQRITNEILSASALMEAFKGMVVPDGFMRKIGPAVNAGRSVLMYGPPGNGKTSFATRLASVFKQVVHIPYAVEIDGSIMQVYDSSLHVAAMKKEQTDALAKEERGIKREDFDMRWVECKRPMMITGGELTLEMLDLKYSATAGFYEAPLHVKALNGTFLVDDFGRQLVSPDQLLNRWIVPMESRFDFLKLQTGKTFQLPFDELLIFSTNLAPNDLMDPAFLRRIPYKIELSEPTREDFRKIFEGVARHNGLTVTDEIFDFVYAEMRVKNNYPLASYQPNFICQQILSGCKFDATPPRFTKQGIVDALSNLFVRKSDTPTQTAAKKAPGADKAPAPSAPGS